MGNHGSPNRSSKGNSTDHQPQNITPTYEPNYPTPFLQYLTDTTREQLRGRRRGVVQAAGNNPVQLPKLHFTQQQILNLN